MSQRWRGNVNRETKLRNKIRNKLISAWLSAETLWKQSENALNITQQRKSKVWSMFQQYMQINKIIIIIKVIVLETLNFGQTGITFM